MVFFSPLPQLSGELEVEFKIFCKRGRSTKKIMIFTGTPESPDQTFSLLYFFPNLAHFEEFFRNTNIRMLPTMAWTGHAMVNGRKYLGQ